MIGGGGLVGRDDVRAELHRAVDTATQGASRLVLLAGEPGIGKTTLLTDALTYARTLGAQVVTAACWDGDGVPGFWPWTQILRALTGSDAADIASLTGTPTGDANRFPVFLATAETLRKAGAEAPVVVMIDDLQWADAGSLRLLEFAARTLREVSVLLLGAYRDVEIGPEHPLRDVLADLPPGSDVLPVVGLSPAEVAAMLGDAPEAAEVHRRTGGNPFFVQQVARLLATNTGGIPSVVGEAIRQRIALLGPSAIEVVTVGAVVGARFDGALLARATGRDFAAVDDALAAAIRARIIAPDVAGFRFEHDLFREFLYGEMSTAVRTAAHRSVATALGEDAPPGTLAHHWTLSVPLTEPEVAAEYEVTAAIDADRRLAYEEAARHWTTALRLGGEMAPWRLSLADSLVRSGEGDAARTAYLQVAATADDPELIGLAGLGLHRAGELSGTSHEGTIRILSRAVSALSDPTGLAARVRAALARELADGPSRDVARATALAVEATAFADAAGDRAAEALCLFAEHDLGWGPGTARLRLALAERMVEAATAGGARDLVFEGLFCRFVALIELADPMAWVALTDAESVAAELREPRPRYLVQSRRATLAILAAQWADGERLAQQAFDLATMIAEPDAMGVLITQLMALEHTRFGVEGMARVLGRPIGVSDTTEAGYPAELDPLLNSVALAFAGATDSAAAILRGLPLPENLAMYRWRALPNTAFEVEAALAAGAADVCAARYEFLAQFAGDVVVIGGAVAVLGPVDLFLGMAAVGCGRTADAVIHLRAAAESAGRLGARALVVRAQVELACVLHATGVAQQRDALTTLAETSDELGMTTHRDRVLQLLTDAESPARAFRRDGDVWNLQFDGRSAVLKDAKGLQDLHRLLSAPGTDVSAAELAGLPDDAGSDAVLDDHAKAAYRTRLDQLDQEIDHPDPKRAERAQAEKDALVAELSRAFGLAGRSRRLGDSGERARTAVTARIRDTLRRIDKVHPALARHLDESITTGRLCSYRPTEPMRWQL